MGQHHNAGESGGGESAIVRRRGRRIALASQAARNGRAARPILEAGRNCWRIESAERASFLVDGDAYFHAFRQAATEARDSLFILGWDFDSRIRMLVDREPDGFPDRLGEFLHRLLIRRRTLHVHVLTWDFHMIYWNEREWWLPSKLAAHRRLHFVKDAVHPLGASHHQKVVVIDDAVAFVGGLDFAQCRWDRPAHEPRHPERRLLADGAPCRPFHDVQMMVDGAAAAALGELARARWARATGQAIPAATTASRARWPAAIEPDVREVRVGIARTIPEYEDQPPVHEIECLYRDSVAAARRHVYIETQYLTSCTVAEAIAERLEDAQGPEIVVILHPNSDGWLEQHTMDVLRGRLLARLRSRDRYGRLRLYYPRIPDLQGHCISMHSKVCIVDDGLVRVGSANLSNRSMGVDTECDLAVESGGEPDIRRRILAFRNRLLAEHLGVSVQDVEAAGMREPSLIRVIEGFRRDEGRSLDDFDSCISAEVDDVVPDADFIDPSRPYEAQLVPREHRPPARRHLVTASLGLLALVLLAAFWQWTPVREQLNVSEMAAALEAWAQGPMAAVVTIAGFMVGSVLVMPVLVLIAVTIVAFGPWWGFWYAFLGMTVSALLTFAIGRVSGRAIVDRLAGTRLHDVSRLLGSKGIVAVITMRVFPLAPFSIINAVAGASHITARDFVVGTVIGELPGLVSLALFIDQINEAVRHPGPGSIGLLAVLAAAIVLAVFGLRRWLRVHPMKEGGDGRPPGAARRRS